MSSISGAADPVVLRITVADVIDALGKGLRDFQALPIYGLAIGALFAGGGILVVLCVSALGMTYLAYPLAAGFALIGPFAAVALYEVSRQREAGKAPSLNETWSATASAARSAGWRSSRSSSSLCGCIRCVS
jgi:uncharacterized membrane protein